MKKLIVDTDIDHTVLVLVDESFNKVTVSKKKFIDLPNSAILEQIEHLRSKYKISKIYVDKSGIALPMYNFLRNEIGYNMVIPITFKRWSD